jgi:hypothetical protein
MHADQIGGLVADGRPVFPSAEVFVNRADIAHFTDPARAAAAPALLKSSFAAAVGLLAQPCQLHAWRMASLCRFDIFPKTRRGLLYSATSHYRIHDRMRKPHEQSQKEIYDD